MALFVILVPVLARMERNGVRQAGTLQFAEISSSSPKKRAAVFLVIRHLLSGKKSIANRSIIQYNDDISVTGGIIWNQRK